MLNEAVITNTLLLNPSNDSIPELQKREVEALISSTREEKRLIEAEIERVQAILTNLQLDVHSKDNQIALLKAAISPLKSLPNEVVSKIFEAYTMEHAEPPWLLCRICTRWREVALTTPALWNRIEIRLRDSAPTYSSFNKEKMLFRMAGNTPISCAVFLKHPSPSIYYFIPLFTQNASRLRYLFLDSIDAFLQLLTLPRGSLPSLETLGLAFCPLGKEATNVPAVTFAGSTPRYPPITLFEDMPHLRRLTIETHLFNRWRNPNMLPLHLPWAQLTRLSISPYLLIGYGALSAVLLQCRNLVTCRVPIPADEPDPNQFRSIHLRHLEDLEITNGYIQILEHGQLLRRLLLPSLKRLILTSRPGRTIRWHRDDIVGLISRSACDVEVFYSRSDISQDLTFALLDAMTSLVELLITNILFLPSIIRRIVHQDFLPNLTSIECRTPRLLSSTVDELIESLGDTGFMEPPIDGRVPLSIVFVCNEGVSDGLALEELRRNLLKVSCRQVIGELMDSECEL